MFVLLMNTPWTLRAEVSWVHVCLHVILSLIRSITVGDKSKLSETDRHWNWSLFRVALLALTFW